MSQSEANAKLDTLRQQAGRNLVNESIYPFNDITPGEPLYFQVRRYFYPESEDSKMERAQHLKQLYTNMGVPMNNTEHKVVAGYHEKIFNVTGYRLKTEQEVLATKLSKVGPTPDSSPKASTSELPDPTKTSIGGQTDNTYLSSVPDPSQAALDLSKEASDAFSEAEDSDSEDIKSSTMPDNTKTFTEKVTGGFKKVLKSAQKVSTMLVEEDLPLDADDESEELSKTIKPSASQLQNPYTPGTNAFKNWAIATDVESELASTPKPKRNPSSHVSGALLNRKKPLSRAEILASPLSGIKAASQRVGDDHASEDEDGQ